ncbi:MAG: RimK family alpha-L-glutamate ligase [Candidatus Bathyarchaeota archaeon]|nr:MAG: RimK family alpha-L-glutamate ligase [Candidatus Bathyarchaeota archaeon]
MNIGIVGKNPNEWGSAQLIASLKRFGLPCTYLSFPKLFARVGYKPVLSVDGIDLIKDLAALIVRPIGRGSLEEIIFRMDRLHALVRRGIPVINSPSAIEHCVDKYYALTLLEENGLPVPRTVVTESAKEALKGFQELGNDIVLKPLFGSRGVGSVRITDVESALRIFNSIQYYHGILYLQEFVPHGNFDIRAFVIGDDVSAAMRRIGSSWKTNVSQGAQPLTIHLDKQMQNLAIEAAKIVGCEIAGVDIIETNSKPLIVEINSQPGWRGLQSVTQTNIADHIVEHVLSKVKR